MLMKGSDIVVESLLEQGVDTIFGYPGGAILEVYDSLYKYQDKIHHVLTSHEQGASHAADGYARATGKVGVCMATSGPGATNLVTGIATAMMDSIPLVALTANVGVNALGKDAFQEPYRMLRFADRTALSDYLMGKYDTSWGQDTASPFIMENDKLMDGWRPNPNRGSSTLD